MDMLRPDDTQAEGLRWDIEIGRSYEVDLEKSKALQHFLSVLRLEREGMLQALVNEDERGDQYKAAIRMTDRLLRVPQKMVADGNESERELSRRVDLQ